MRHAAAGILQVLKGQGNGGGGIKTCFGFSSIEQGTKATPQLYKGLHWGIVTSQKEKKEGTRLSKMKKNAKCNYG